jgi:hypothetical protein
MNLFFFLLAQPERITVRNRIPRREPIHVEPPRDPDRVRLRELPGGGVVVPVAHVHLPGGVAHPHGQAAEPVVLVPRRLLLARLLVPGGGVPSWPRHRDAPAARRVRAAVAGAPRAVARRKCAARELTAPVLVRDQRADAQLPQLAEWLALRRGGAHYYRSRSPSHRAVEGQHDCRIEPNRSAVLYRTGLAHA